MERIFNVSFRKVGGIRFLKVGRFFFSFGMSRTYRALDVSRDSASIESR